MTDVLDRAQEIEQQQREQALMQAKQQPEQPNELDGHRYCLDCDVGIKTKRLLAAPNAVRCVDCQELHEHHQKQYRR